MHFQSSLSAENKRTMKIEKYKRDKAAKTRINVSNLINLLLYETVYFTVYMQFCFSILLIQFAVYIVMFFMLKYLPSFLQELQRLLYMSKKKEQGEGGGDAIDYEEERRELYIAQLQCFARDAIDELDMLQQVS